MLPVIVYMSDGTWKHTNSKVSLKAGDVINYWIVFDTTHGSYQKIEQHSTIAGKQCVNNYCRILVEITN